MDAGQEMTTLPSAPARTGEGSIDRLRIASAEVKCFTSGVTVTVSTDGKTVADRCVRILFIYPLLSRRFQYKQFLSVHDQECVVIVKVMVIAAVATLTIGFQQGNQQFQRFPGIFRPFKRQTHHVHTGKACLSIGTLREHGFIANTKAKFIHAHLRAPHPGRTGQKNLKGPLCLWYGNIGTMNHSGQPLSSRVMFQNLHFIGTTVTVLRKERPFSSDFSQGIAHIRFLPSVIQQKHCHIIHIGSGGAGDDQPAYTLQRMVRVIVLQNIGDVDPHISKFL